MDAGVGVSTELVAEAAAQAAARAAMERLGSVQATLALLFASYHYREKYPSLVSIVRAVTGAPQLVGCSASGVLAPEGEFEGVPAVTVLAVRDPAHEPVAFLAPGQLGDPAALAGFRQSLLGHGAEGGLLFLFPDVSQETPSATLKSVEDALGHLPIVGGAAAGDPAGLRCFKFFGSEVAEDALAGVLLRPSGSAYVGVTSGCRPVGRPFTVTKAEGNVIWEIASRPAAEILGRVLAEISPTPQTAPQGLFLGVAHNPSRYPLGRGDFLVRNLLRVDTEEGAIAVGERVAVGETVQFHVLDREAAHQDLLVMTSRLKTRLTNVRPRFGLYVNCLGRGQGLYGTLHHDVALIREVLGEFPLTGFFSNAELAPLNDVNYVHQYAGVLTVFA